MFSLAARTTLKLQSFSYIIRISGMCIKNLFLQCYNVITATCLNDTVIFLPKIEKMKQKKIFLNTYDKASGRMIFIQDSKYYSYWTTNYILLTLVKVYSL